MADGLGGTPAMGGATPTQGGAPTNGANGAQLGTTPTAPRPTNGAPAPARVEGIGGPARGADGKFMPSQPGEAGNVSPEQAKAAEVAAQKLRVKGEIKLYGKTEAVDEELSSDDVLRERQIRRGLEQKIQKHEERARHAQRLAELAESDPHEFLRQLGKDPEKLAEEMLAKRARLAMMTDEQRAIAERDEKLAKYEAADQERRTKERAAFEEQRQTALIERYKQEFSQVAEAHGLERTWDDLARFADAKEKLLRATGGIAPTVSEIAQAAKSAIDKDVNRSIAHLEGEALLRRLGNGVLSKVTKALLERHATQHGSVQQQVAPSAPVQPPKPGEYISDAELNERMRQLTNKK